jgi:V-type H+-transporting ATPase subunit a
MLYPYRYLVTLMGFFAAYCGFIYNDFLSISLNLFGTCFNVAGTTNSGGAIHKYSADCVYPFGLDPAWSIATNNLNYVNSLKMKLSVILGVTHMLVGVFVKASNAKYFNKKIDFFF